MTFILIVFSHESVVFFLIEYILFYADLEHLVMK
jgi:hypothetical protein